MNNSIEVNTVIINIIKLLDIIPKIYTHMLNIKIQKYLKSMGLTLKPLSFTEGLLTHMGLLLRKMATYFKVELSLFFILRPHQVLFFLETLL